MIPLLFPFFMLGAASLGIAAMMTVGDQRVTLPHGWSWAQLSRSATAERLGLDNTPGPDARRRLANLVKRVLEPLSAELGRELVLTSGYRAPRVNAAVGSESTSQHVVGEAVDFHVPGVPSGTVAATVIRLGLPFHELIWYAPERGGHVHVSLRADGASEGRVRFAPVGSGLVTRMPR